MKLHHLSQIFNYKLLAYVNIHIGRKYHIYIEKIIKFYLKYLYGLNKYISIKYINTKNKN